MSEGVNIFQEASFMNDALITKAREDKELVICPYNEKNLTPVGYNLSFTRFIVSLRKKTFVKIDHKDDEWFFILRPHETVLVLTRESVWVSRYIGGTFHSKVSLVTKGLGHVSTTLDPGWYGQLLVPLNNPTKEKIKVVIAHDINGQKEYQTFITMVLFRAREASLREKTDNKSGRIELLEEILKEKKKNRDAKYLSEFIQQLKQNNDEKISIDNLNDPQDRTEKIKKFEEGHLRMISEMDARFEGLNRFSTKEHNKQVIIYCGIIMIWTLALAVLGLLGYNKLDEMHDLALTMFSCAIPISVFIWEKLYSRICA